MNSHKLHSNHRKKQVKFLIMLRYRPEKMMDMRGIQKKTAFLVKLGMTHSAASRYLNTDMSMINVDTMEKVCIALNCTPSDLFEWTPDKNTVVAENHSLHSLGKKKSLQEIVKDIPSDKLKLVEELLNQLKE